MKMRHFHESREKTSQFVHAAEILNLDALERKMLNERIKEIELVLALHEQLKFGLDSSCYCHTYRTSRLCLIAASIASGS